VSALSGVARVVAVSDPARAARLLGEAERIANFLTDESAKGSALRDLAVAVAVRDPDRAERIANSITGKFEKAQALSIIITTVLGS
jgi:hypothetical protein